MRGLIVNADDLGAGAAGDRRILAAHAGGVVTSTSLLTRGVSAREGVQAALAAGLAVGLHVDLTALVPGGPLAVVRALATLPAAAIEEACEAQLEEFAWLAGRAPRHLDAHQHLVHFAPAAFAGYLAVARRHALPVRSPAPFLTAGALADFCARVERENGVPLAAALPPPEALARELASVWSAAGVAAPRLFEHSFYGARATTAHLCGLIAGLPEGVSEMMCHPARPGEVEVLTDPEVRRALKHAGVDLLTYDDL